MRIGWRPVQVALALAGAAPLTVAGQPTVRVAGTVRRTLDAGPVPVPAVRVVLHRVGRATQGPIDSTITGPEGRFRFVFPVDTTANFLLSAHYAGIEYFSNPVVTNPARPDTAVEVLVSDTSASAPVAVRTRTFVVSAPDATGLRSGLDWIVLRNSGPNTRVAADSLAPTWGVGLPVGARNPRVGDPRLSQFSPEAVEFRGDSVYLTAPISPGEKELLLQYELPAKQHRFEVSLLGTDSVEAYLEETGITAPRAGWAVSDSQAFEGRRFRRLIRTDHAIGQLDLRFPGLGLDPDKALVWMVGGFGLALALVGWQLHRRRPRSPAASAAGLARRPPGS